MPYQWEICPKIWSKIEEACIIKTILASVSFIRCIYNFKPYPAVISRGIRKVEKKRGDEKAFDSKVSKVEEGISRARVTQIPYLENLHPEIERYLTIPPAERFKGYFNRKY